MTIVFFIHLAATLFMSGLCWFVQVVHYPLFHEISNFEKYERKNFRTAWVAVPVMVVELVTCVILLVDDVSNWILITNLLLLGIIGLSTFFFQVPLHLKLTQEASTRSINQLVRSNWIRTISWTIRALLLFFLLWQMLIKAG